MGKTNSKIGGIGVDALFLARKSYIVTYFDADQSRFVTKMASKGISKPTTFNTLMSLYAQSKLTLDRYKRAVQRSRMTFEPTPVLAKTQMCDRSKSIPYIGTVTKFNRAYMHKCAESVRDPTLRLPLKTSYSDGKLIRQTLSTYCRESIG